MKVGIIGGGALGLLFASYIARAAIHDVTIYTRRQNQADCLNNEGLQLISKGKQFNFRIRAEILHNQRLEQDILIIAVKQYHLGDLLTNFPYIQQINTILFIQNGMGHIPYLDKLSNDSIYLGVVEHGAMLLSSHAVEHTGIGKTKLSSYKGDSVVPSDFFSTVDCNTFHFEYKDDWFQMLTEKLVINSVINPLTAVYRVTNGELLSNTYFYEMMKVLFNEVISIFPSKSQNLWERVVEVCEKTANNRSSMLKDLEEGRRTEIDAILGYVIEVGENKGFALPVSTFLYHSIKGLEKGGL
jgi:2-dehydropantoate 2-reductase